MPIEFVSSHKTPVDTRDEDSSAEYEEEEEDDDYSEKKSSYSKDLGKPTKKVVGKFENFDKVKSNYGTVEIGSRPSGGWIGLDNTKKQARVELENFGDTGILQEDGFKNIDRHRTKLNDHNEDSVIPGVRVR